MMKLKSFKPFAALIVLALVLIAYSNSFNADFHFDDIDKIPNNPVVRDLSNIPHFFASAGDSYLLRGFEFRPVKYATIALNYHLFGYRPWSYHLFNLLLHLVNCLLVFTAVRLVYRAGGREGGAAAAAAFTAASIFALHPLQTGTVMYLSNGRGVLLAGMFYLLAFVGFVRFRESVPEDGRKGYIWGVLSPVFFMLGLLSKEIIVTLPAVMALFDMLFTVRKTGVRKAAAYYVPFAAVLLVFVFWKMSVHGYMAVRETPYPVHDYLLSEAKALLLYIRLIFLPFNQNADYFLPATTTLGIKSAAGLAVLAASSVFLYTIRRKDPAAAFFGAWFFILLIPESSFVSFWEIAVEYRLYLPLAGFVAAAVSLAAGSRTVRDNQALAVRFVAGLLIIFCALSFARNTVWRTETTFWGDAVEKSPWSPRAHANLGRAMLIEKRYAEAAAELSKSLELDPDYRQAGVVHFNLGMCYYENGIMGMAAEQFEAAINKGWDKLEVYNKLGEAYYSTGRYMESAQAYRRAFVPGLTDPALEYNLATALMMAGQDEEALGIFERLIEENFDSYDVRYNLALLYKKKGMMAKAVENARQAERMAEDEQGRRNAEEITEGR